MKRTGLCLVAACGQGTASPAERLQCGLSQLRLRSAWKASLLGRPILRRIVKALLVCRHWASRSASIRFSVLASPEATLAGRSLAWRLCRGKVMSDDRLCPPALAFREPDSSYSVANTAPHRQGSCSYSRTGPGGGSICPSLSGPLLVPILKKAQSSPHLVPVLTWGHPSQLRVR